MNYDVEAHAQNMRDEAYATAHQCPLCFMAVVPENWQSHMEHHHPGVVDEAVFVDDEFQALIPHLSPEEHAALEASLLAEGCRDALVVWKGYRTLLDGHNRYALCRKHDLSYQVVEIECESREDAMIWMIKNQRGRRNLTPYQNDLIALKEKDLLSVIYRRNQATSGKGIYGGKPLSPNSEKAVSDADAWGEAAKNNHTSKDSMSKVQFIEDNAPEEIKGKARSNEISRNEAYKLTKELADAPREVARVVEQHGCDNAEKVKILKRLYDSRDKAGSNGTFDEIAASGGFHWGEEMDEWCAFFEADIEDISRGLKSLAKHHAGIAVDSKKPFVAHNTGEKEWYTPPHIIAAAVATMGSIDCDPASTHIANNIVGAHTFFTMDDDGLIQQWEGNVWLNPPYAQPLMAQFADKLVEQRSTDNVAQACVLVNNATETGWFQTILRIASAICLLDGRVKFLDTDLNPGAPLQGQIVLYVGGRVEAFAEHFSELGPVLYVR